MKVDFHLQHTLGNNLTYVSSETSKEHEQPSEPKKDPKTQKKANELETSELKKILNLKSKDSISRIRKRYSEINEDILETLIEYYNPNLKNDEVQLTETQLAEKLNRGRAYTKKRLRNKDNLRKQDIFRPTKYILSQKEISSLNIEFINEDINSAHVSIASQLKKSQRKERLKALEGKSTIPKLSEELEIPPERLNQFLDEFNIKGTTYSTYQMYDVSSEDKAKLKKRYVEFQEDFEKRRTQTILDYHKSQGLSSRELQKELGIGRNKAVKIKRENNGHISKEKARELKKEYRVPKGKKLYSKMQIIRKHDVPRDRLSKHVKKNNFSLTQGKKTYVCCSEESLEKMISEINDEIEYEKARVTSKEVQEVLEVGQTHANSIIARYKGKINRNELNKLSKIYTLELKSNEKSYTINELCIETNLPKSQVKNNLQLTRKRIKRTGKGIKYIFNTGALYLFKNLDVKNYKIEELMNITEISDQEMFLKYLNKVKHRKRITKRKKENKIYISSDNINVIKLENRIDNIGYKSFIKEDFKLLFQSEADKPLSREQEQLMFRIYEKSKKQNDSRTTDKVESRLIQANQAFVSTVSELYKDLGVSKEDLINAGNIGLIKAIRRFDYKKNFKLISYAVWYIRSEITQELDKMARSYEIHSNQRVLNQEIRKNYDALEQKFERKPTITELSEKLNMETKKLEYYFNINNKTKYLDKRSTNTDSCLLDNLTYEEDEPPYDFDTTSNTQILNSITKILSDKEKTSLYMYHGIYDNYKYTLNEIGEHLNISREEARRIISHTFTKLKKYHGADKLEYMLNN